MSNAPSRRRTITVWSLTVITAVPFAGAGMFKVSGSEQMVTAFADFGFPLWFMTLIGIGELASALALLLPPIAFLGGLGMMVVAGGAVVSHIANGDAVTAAIPAIVLFVLASIVAWLRGGDFARTASRLFPG